MYSRLIRVTSCGHAPIFTENSFTVMYQKVVLNWQFCLLFFSRRGCCWKYYYLLFITKEIYMFVLTLLLYCCYYCYREISKNVLDLQMESSAKKISSYWHWHCIEKSNQMKKEIDSNLETVVKWLFNISRAFYVTLGRSRCIAQYSRAFIFSSPGSLVEWKRRAFLWAKYFFKKWNDCNNNLEVW